MKTPSCFFSYDNHSIGQVKLSEGAAHIIPNLKPINRGKVVDISQRLGTPKMECPEWLILTPKDQIPVPERLAFPPPEKGKGKFLNKSILLSKNILMHRN